MEFTYQEIEPLIVQGKTPTQIATLLNDSGLTSAPLSTEKIRTFLREKDLLSINLVNGGYEGKLVQYAMNANNPKVMRDATVVFAKRIMDPGVRNIDTNTPGDDPRNLLLLIKEYIAKGVMTLDEANEFYAPGGGLRFVGVNAEKVQQVIADYGFHQSIEETRQRWSDASNAAVLAASRGEADPDAAGIAVIEGV